MKLFLKSSAITLLSAMVLASPVLAASRTFSQPTYKPSTSTRQYPIDATYAEWNGQNEDEGHDVAADLFCQFKGYQSATDWSVAKDQPATQRGTYRFSRDGGKPEYCDFCRWHFTRVRCYKP